MPWLRRLSSASLAWDRRVHLVESHEEAGWLDSTFIEREYIRPQISGDRDVDYISHFLNAHVSDRPVERALSLGCGGGNLERALIALDAAKEIDAADISGESIALAVELAEAQGHSGRLHYRVENIDEIELPAATYDFVVIKQALHHIERLEHVYDQLHRALKPNGVLMLNEYVGPSRFQWTPLQLELMNKMFKTLPASVRQKAPFLEIHRPTVEEMLFKDPSEAARSAEILPLLSERFEVVENKPYGGPLLHMLLSDIMPLLELDKEDRKALLRSYFLFEKTLLEHQVLEHDFAYVVARPLLEIEAGPE